MKLSLFINRKQPYPRITALGILFSLSLQGSNVEAMDLYGGLLEECRGAFKAAPTLEEKFAVITKPMDARYLSELERDETPLIKSDKLYPGTIDQVMNRTHPLAIYICQADIKRVEKSLKTIKDPNDPGLLVRGYRQAYNLVSLATDPIWPVREAHALSDRLAIITLLGEFEGKKSAKFDFDFLPDTTRLTAMGLKSYGHYYNPPLVAASAVHGNYGSIFKEENITECQEAVQARLMLYGADPKICGSSSSGPASVEGSPHVQPRMLRLAGIALNQAVEEKLNQDFLRPTPYVQGFLAVQKQETLKGLYLQRETLILESIGESKKLNLIKDKIKYLENWML